MTYISSRRSILCSLLPLAILATAINLSGCAFKGGVGTGSTAVLPTKPGAVYEGRVFGGEQPLVGATIQLYAAGAPASGGGYGQGSTALIAPTSLPVTDSNGSFSVTGLYTCPMTPAVSQVYMVATGGSSGAGNPVNPKVALMAALGSCTAGGTLNPNLNIWINEVTTIASVYALQQFMAAPSATNVGAPRIGAPGNTYNGVQSAVLGLTNAFGMVNNLVNISTGSAATPTNAWSTPETAKINTLANILVHCVNSNPAASTSCSDVFSHATPTTSPASFTAADTIQAAWYIAQNPGNNVSTLCGYSSSTPAFIGLGGCTSAYINDFTLAVNLAPQYTSGTSSLYAVNTPHHVGIDKYGNVWLSNVANSSGIVTTVAAPAGVVELAPNGSVLMNPVGSFTAATTGGTYGQFTTKPSSTTINYYEPRMVAIDTSNNVWVANYMHTKNVGTPGAGTVGTFTGSAGVGVAGSVNGGYFVGADPWGIAIDGNNNVYVSNTGGSGMDPLSIGRFAGGTGTYTYSTSSSTAGANSLPNVQAVTGSYMGIGNWSAVIAIDTNTGVTGGADGILWTAELGCVVTSSSSQYDYDSPSGSTTNPPANVAWGVVGLFNADTLTPLSEAQATTMFSGASTGPGSTTNCGSTTAAANNTAALSGAGLQIGQLFSAGMAMPYGVAVDRNNGVWIADSSFTKDIGFNGLTYLAAPSASSGLIPNSAYIINGNTLAPTSAPAQGQVERSAAYIEVDGNNHVWLANSGFGTIADASYTPGATTPITYLTPASQDGWAHGSFLANAYGLALDLSGNVWVTSTNNSATYTGSAGNTINVGAGITVLVGAAGPVITPLSERVASNMLGQKP